MTRARSYKADYDGKQGEPYVRAKGKCKSQLDFASRFDTVKSKFPLNILPLLLKPSPPMAKAHWYCICNIERSNDRCLVSTHQEMFKDYDRKRDVRLTSTAMSQHATRPHAAQVDDVQRFGDKGTFFTSHDILDHGHRRKPQTFDG